MTTPFYPKKTASRNAGFWSLPLLILFVFFYSLNPLSAQSSDCCDQGDKPNLITFTYTGQGCSATVTSQDPDKFDCSGSPNFDPMVYIVGSEKENGGGKVWFAGNVALGEQFSLSAALAGEDDFPSNTFITIYSSQSGAILQRVNFYTSCSQPLSEDDQYGASEVIGIRFKDGTTCGEPDTPPTPADCCDIGDKPNLITFRYTGEGCSATVSGQDSDKFSCSGSPNFDPSVYIVGSEKENGGGKIWFAGNVNLNDQFTLSAAAAGEDDFKSNTFITIYASQGGAVLQRLEFHTSCSQPLGADDQYGAARIEVIEFKDGTSCGELLGCLGDFVFEDLDEDGVQDFGEPGVPNIKLELFLCSNGVITDTKIGETVTDVNGFYEFCELHPGEYAVKVGEIPDGFRFCVPDQGGDDALDSDVDPATGFTDCVQVPPGTVVPTVDIGIKNICDNIFMGAAISGVGLICDPGTGEDVFTLLQATPPPGAGPEVSYQWEVSTVSQNGPFIEIENANGENYNAPAKSLEQWYRVVTKNALDCTEEFFSSAFLVVLLPPSDITITPGELDCETGTLVLETDIELCAGAPIQSISWTGPNSFTSDEQSPTISESGTYKITVTGGGVMGMAEITVTVDPGAKCASLGDCVWNDANSNSLKDPGESGIPGVPVKLYDCNGNFKTSTTTDLNGHYQFIRGSGSYVVKVIDNFTFLEFSKKGQGTNPAVDSDVDPATGLSDCISLTTPGDSDFTIDAGLCPVSSKGGSRLGSDNAGIFSTTPSTVGASPFTNGLKVKVRAYPNPIGNRFNVSVEHTSDEPVLLTIFNSLGQEIHRQRVSDRFHDLSISSENWARGTYLLRVSADNDMQSIRLLKQ